MSARRLVAVGAAAGVTVLTMSGLFGFGPSAAVAQTSQPPGQVTDTAATPDNAGDTTPDATPDTAPETTSETTTSGNGWLTIEDKPGSSGQSAQDTTLPADTGTGTRVVYDVSAQRVWLVDADGTVERTYLVSGGKDPTTLEPGQYAVSSKSRDAISYNHKETMRYMVRFATGEHAPIGFHDIPLDKAGNKVQTNAELGMPLSSGCIRQAHTDAKALWRFTTVGTVVVVTP